MSCRRSYFRIQAVQCLATTVLVTEVFTAKAEANDPTQLRTKNLLPAVEAAALAERADSVWKSMMDLAYFAHLD